VSIDAKLDCDAFASTHSATSHYDRASFVGLAWRPGGENICCGALRATRSNPNNGPSPRRRAATPPSTSPACSLPVTEIYSTGKANLPGSTRQRDLLSSFARMVSELLRHSDKPGVCERIPEHLRLCHRPRRVTRDDAPVVAHSKASAVPVAKHIDLFGNDDAWHLGPLSAVAAEDVDAKGGDELLELAGF
jgi:hypothetical protein